MAYCHGILPKKPGHAEQKCGGTLYRCKRCGHIGCERDNCPNRVFLRGGCTRCGSTANKESVR